MGRRVLALDVGNSRIKWGLSNAQTWIEGGVIEGHLTDRLPLEWDRLPVPDIVIGCNVAGESRIVSLSRYWHDRGLKITWIKSSAMSCGVVNKYEQPEQLGADRWAALISAWHKVQGPCLVVSAGTAMTIDMLDAQGQFIGGQILPGRRLMQASLAAGTHALTAVPAGQVTACPLNTADAVTSGIAGALVSSIESAFHRLESRTGSEPVCLLTGGDAGWLARQMKIAFRIEEKLILDGLLKLAEEDIEP